MLFGLTKTVPSPILPVSLDLAKSHLRCRNSRDDALILQYLAACVTQIEREARTPMGRATWVYAIDRFPTLVSWEASSYTSVRDRHEVYEGNPRLTMFIPIQPIVAVSSITYKDLGGNTVTLDPSKYSVGYSTGRIFPYPSWPPTWPITDVGVPENVKVTFTAGPENPKDVPADLIQAVLLQLADMYENRGEEAHVDLQRSINPAAARICRGYETGNVY